MSAAGAVFLRAAGAPPTPGQPAAPSSGCVSLTAGPSLSLDLVVPLLRRCRLALFNLGVVVFALYVRGISVSSPCTPPGAGRALFLTISLFLYLSVLHTTRTLQRASRVFFTLSNERSELTNIYSIVSASPGSQLITSLLSFLLPLESTYLEPRITREDREDFLVFEVQV